MAGTRQAPPKQRAHGTCAHNCYLHDYAFSLGTFLARAITIRLPTSSRVASQAEGDLLSVDDSLNIDLGRLDASFFVLYPTKFGAGRCVIDFRHVRCAPIQCTCSNGAGFPPPLAGDRDELTYSVRAGNSCTCMCEGYDPRRRGSWPQWIMRMMATAAEVANSAIGSENGV